MLTKKFTEFSADLLDTVAGILGEAKKCSDCGCAKCECEDDEDEDEMKESTAEYGKSIDAQKKKNITASDQNKISKLAAMMKAEKKPVKEESEQLDEYGLVIPRRDNLVSLKKHSFDNDFEDEMKKTRQTKKSVADAKKKYAKEEAEQIDELSDALLKSYSKKALAQSKTATGDQKLKRQVGARNAIDRLGNNTLAKEEVELEEGESKTGLPKSTAEKNKQYIEVTHLLGHKKRVPVHPTNAYKALNHYRNDPTTKSARIVSEEVEQLDELSKKTLGSYAKKATNQAFGKGVAGGAALASTNKETEDQGHKLVNKAAKRMQGAQKAISKLTKEEQDFIDSLNAMDLDEARGRPRKAGAKDFTIHPKTKEKLMHNNPEHMKKIEALQRNGVLEKPKTEAGQHIINQLRKASTSMTGGTTIHFTHGDSKHVSGTHATKLLDKYAGMKPNEKEDFQKKIGHSHEQLMKHV